MKTVCKVLLAGILMAFPVMAQYAPSGPSVPQVKRDPTSGISLPNPSLNMAGFVFQDLIVQPGDYIRDKGSPTCKDGRISKAAEQAAYLAQGFLTGALPGLAPLAQQGGALEGEFVTRLKEEAAKGTSATLVSLASQFGLSPRYAACGTFVLVVPKGYHVIGHKFMAHNEQEWLSSGLLLDCTTEQNPYVVCPIPDGRFFTVLNGNVAISTFINWAREARFVRVIIYFAPNNP